MKKPILTIGIPTYNRPKSIVSTVRKLLPQLNEKVVLIVWDNCSQINVASLFNEEEKKQFTIHRNRTNIGGDANICGVIYNSDTKWVWDLGDDDDPKENAVETIINYIEKYPDNVMFNFNSYIQRDVNSFNEIADICGYMKIYSNFLYISSGIYNREKLIDYLQQYYINLSSKVGQTIFVLKYLEDHNGVVSFLSDKIVNHSVNITDASQDEIEGTTWTQVEFVVCSSIIFRVFKNKEKYLRKNLFKELARSYIRAVFVSHELSFRERLALWSLIVHTVGGANIIRYNTKTIIQYIVRMILPQRVYNLLKIKVAKSLEKHNINALISKK